MKPTISLVMIVKDEEAVLRRCLNSVARYVDEIIIVDTGSTDRTKEIALEFNAKIYDFVWNNDFSSARNFALSKARTSWCLVMDADEYISNDCTESLNRFMQNEPSIGKIKRIDKFKGTDGVNYEQSYISRLFPSYCRYTGRIHEQIETELPRLYVDIEIQHDGYFQQTKSDRNIPILKSVIAEHPIDPYYHFQIAKEYRGLGNHELTYQHLKQAYQLMTHNEVYAPNIVVHYLYAIIASGHLEEGIPVIDNEREFLWNFPDFFFVTGLYLLELISSDPDTFGHLIPLIEQYYRRAIEIGDNQHEGSVLGTGSYAAFHNLGVFYEVVGNVSEAIKCYEQAAALNYEPSIERLKNVEKSDN